MLFYKQAVDSIEVVVLLLLLTVEKMNKMKTMEKAIPFPMIT